MQTPSVVQPADASVTLVDVSPGLLRLVGPCYEPQSGSIRIPEVPPPTPAAIVTANPSLSLLTRSEQARLRAKAEALQNFFWLFFRSTEQVRIFPIMRDEVAARWDRNPLFPDKICGRWVKWRGRPITKFREGISLRVGSSRFANAILKLEEFNRWGYDIYWCINPLSANRRLQCTVREIRTIMIESDSNPLDEQIATESALKRHLRASEFTGSKSLHMYVRIEPPIRNHDCVYNWRQVKAIKSGDGPKIDILDYNAVVEQWRSFLVDKGFSPDMNVLSDFSRLSRVPVFLNHKTGNLVEFRHGDFDAWWITKSPIIWKSNSGIGHQIKPRIPEPSSIDADNGLLEPGVLVSGYTGEPVAHVCDPIGNTATTNVTIKPLSARLGRTFLDSLGTYQRLRLEGILRRHTRNQLHIDLLQVARLLDWNDRQLASEWKSIVSIRPENIGCSVDDAARDLLSHRKRSTVERIWLPNTTRLPDQIDGRESTLKLKLRQLGCPDPSSCTRIISEILYPLVRTLPRQCELGTISIQSRELQRRCVSKRSRLAMTWLHAWNVLRVVDHNYARGTRTKRYWVNVGLVLWLTGFRNQDLDWQTV